MSEATLTLGYSPCPNDTFIFHALVHGRVDAGGKRFDVRLDDVETLNRWALGRNGTPPPDVCKVSFGALPHLLDEYVLLRSGGALGRGCGPLLVARADAGPAAPRRVAIPGRLTTANLLLRLWDPALPPGEERVYSEIMPAVARGEADAGLIIHESRFTYPQHGLRALVDLGEWWERETGLPIPLGGIVARRTLGRARIQQIEAAIRASVEHAFRHPEHSAAYVKRHAQELDPDVARRHIELYVTRHSVELGRDGEGAVLHLLRRAAEAGLAPPPRPPFAD